MLVPQKQMSPDITLYRRFRYAVGEGFEQMGSMLPDTFTDVMLKMEDNYAQINCISSFFWCVLLGLVFSAILSRSTSGNRSVFTPEEMNRNQDDEFNF